MRRCCRGIAFDSVSSLAIDDLDARRTNQNVIAGSSVEGARRIESLYGVVGRIREAI